MPKRAGLYLRVKEKGDTVTFRIAQTPVYTGKHFIQKEAGWDVTECPRIATGEECQLCELFFAAKKEEKEAHEAGDVEREKGAKSEARKYSPATIFYIAILNRLTEEMAILQTTQGVRNEINKLYENGVRIHERDLVLTNTGSSSPKDRYAVSVVDSSESSPLTEKETVELGKALMYDMSKIGDATTAQDDTIEPMPEED